MIFHVHVHYCIVTDMLYHFMYNILYYTEQPNSNAIFQCRCISLNWTTSNGKSCVMTMKYIDRFSIVLLGYHVGFWYGIFEKILLNNVFLFSLILYLGSIWLKIIDSVFDLQSRKWEIQLLNGQSCNVLALSLNIW